MLIAAALLALSGAAATPGFTSPDELQSWLMHYHRQPQPERAVAALVALEEELPRHGTSLEAEAGRGGMRSFFGRVLASSPAAVAAVAEHPFPPGTRRFVAEALWRCGTRPCRAALETLGRTSEGDAPDVRLLPLESPSTIDDLWASFSATGDPAYVERVIEALPASAEPPPAAGSAAAVALRSLAVNAVRHPEVLSSCAEAALAAEGHRQAVLEEIVRRAGVAGASGR